MKKLLLATAVAALSVSAAQAAPTVYGKVLLTADYVDGNVEVVDNGVKVADEDYSNTELNSTGSRIGLKGGEPLTANTDLVYQLEYGIDVDENSQQFKSRDTYIGLANKQYGTLVAGRLSALDDNINYAAQTVGLYDSYNTGFKVTADEDTADLLDADVGEEINLGLASWDGDRANNSLAYFSPSYNGLQLMAMYVMEENNSSDLVTDAEAFGAGVKYEPANQPFRAGLTHIASSDFSTTRVSGAYDLNAVTTLGALYQVTDLDESENENLFTLSGAYKTATPWTVYGQADMVKNLSGLDGVDGSRFVVGGKYGFNKATTGHVYAGYSTIEAEEDNTSLEAKGFGIGTGIEYKF